MILHLTWVHARGEKVSSAREYLRDHSPNYQKYLEKQEQERKSQQAMEQGAILATALGSKLDDTLTALKTAAGAMGGASSQSAGANLETSP